MEYSKFPRTPHLPWSPGFSGDDIRLADVTNFNWKRLIITEKLDGENITVYSDGHIHARSVDGGNHSSRNYLKNLMPSKLVRSFPNIGNCRTLYNGWRICGEYLYAIHSIEYEKLSDYFFVFSVIDDAGVVQEWDMVKNVADYMGLPTVPVIAEMECGSNWVSVLKKQTDKIMTSSRFGSTIEGYVIRNADSFPYSEYGKNVAKYVREGHVAENAEHWSKKWRKATLYKELS